MALITKIKTVYSEVIAALGFTPENSANKDQPNGYAGLDSAGTITANLTGLASTATTLTAGNAELYTNTLPNITGADSTYIYVGRWTTTQTLEKLSLKILYNNNFATSDTRRTSEYLFYFNTSDGTQFVTGSTGNFYGWGRGLTLGEGGAIPSGDTLVIQTSTTQYDIYIRLISGISAGNGAYVVNISGGSWTHSGTDFGTTAPTGNSYTLYLDKILSNYSNPTFASLALIGRLSQDTEWNATDGAGNIQLNNGIGNRIEFIASGVAAPSTTTRSVGTKLVLRPAVNATNLDYALGISTNTLWYSAPSTSQFHTFYCGNVSMRIGNAGSSSRGVVYEGNSAIAMQSTTATLTIAQLLTLVIRTIPTANITLTLPTGPNTDAGVMSGLESYRSFTWSIVNTSAFLVTMAGSIGMTYVGNATISAYTSASFRTIKTATNTFTTYRI